MMVRSARIDGNDLKVNLEEETPAEGQYQLCIQRRNAGQEEKELTYAFVLKGQESDGKCILEASADLKELQALGYYWDLYLDENGTRTKLAVSKAEMARIKGRANSTGFQEKPYASVRLYPKGNGELFLKKVYKDAVLQIDNGTNMRLEEFLNGDKCEKKGSRYVTLTGDDQGKILIEFKEAEDLTGGEAAVVLIGEKEEKKYIFPALEKDGCYEASLMGLSEAGSSKKTFGLYFAAKKDGRYYLVRLKEKKETAAAENRVSSLVREDLRYKALIPLGEADGKNAACMIYCGVYNELLSVMLDEESECRALKAESYRIFTEKMEEPYPFRFSIVMAVYNVENYLMEAVESVFAQDIGFEKHIQLILSDDGSKDRSGELCDQIAERYPGNIIVIHKENGGAASARNEGKKHAQGKYVNFMDPDDWISPDVCSKVWEFFEENQDKTDVVAFPIRFFGELDGEYWQNYKFEKGSRIIDLYKEYENSDMNTAASFVKNKVVQQHEFDGRTPVGEDLKYLLYILLDKMKLGVVDHCWYYYRRHAGSLISSSRQKKSFYLDYMECIVEEIMQYCLEKYGYLARFVQNTLMMDLQWKLLMKSLDQEVLSGEELEIYKEKIVKALQNIEDEVILEQRKIFSEHKYQIFWMKYQKMPKALKVFKDILYQSGSMVFHCESEMITVIEFIGLDSQRLTLKGYSNVLGIQQGDQVETYTSIDGVLRRCEKGGQEMKKYNFIGQLYHYEPFAARIPITEEMLGKRIYLYTVINGHAVARRNLKFSESAPVSGKTENQYYVKDQLVLKRDGFGLYMERCETDRERTELENVYCAELRGLCSKKEQNNQIDEAAAIIKALVLRKNYFKPSFWKKKDIWIISDGIHAAGDRGEALFLYLNQIKPRDIAVYFVISEELEDYERMKKLRNVLIYKSEEHLRLQLQASRVISSREEDEVRQPFGEMYDYLRDLCRYKFVFLQNRDEKDENNCERVYNEIRELS